MIIQQRRRYADNRIRARKGIQILMRKALIIGGGPAGLTAAYELLKASETMLPLKSLRSSFLKKAASLGEFQKQ